MKYPCLVVGFILFIVSSVTYATISIVHVNHPSNYKLSKDRDNLGQLTDGHIQKHPIWTRKGSLGWVNRTPLSINIMVSSVQGKKRCGGSIRIHTGKSVRSGVDIPKRVDVYFKNPNGDYKYLSGKYIDTSDYNDGTSHWIELSNVGIYTDMVLIIHGRDRFIMLDEIDVVAHNCNDTFSLNEDIKSINDPVSDSSSRLKRYYRSNLVQQQKVINKKVAVSVYNDIDELTSGKYSKYQTPDDITGYYGESESRIIKISNGTDDNIKFNIETSYTESPASFIVYKVEKVLAANGISVYDPLIPVPDKNLSVDKNSEAVYLVKFKLDNSSQMKFQLSTDNEVYDQSLYFNIKVLNINPIDVSPMINVWAYRQEYLFRNNESKAMDLMNDCGVNVFVLHSSLLPGKRNKQQWGLEDRHRLIDDLKFYKDKGLILLFVNWGEEITGYDMARSVDEELIRNWLIQITDVMAVSGISYDQWALYPVDEPSGSEFEYLAKLISVVKKVDNKVRVYVNPISTNTDPTYSRHIAMVSDQVDYWQPDIKYVKNKGKNYFSALDKKWWVYNNPKSPAKSSGDLFYRSMAWDAWVLGAKGIGFWSFSDTGRSSAWDDYDGRRPDYAVVYEYKDTVIPSLRWESFCDGVEDFRLLNSLGDNNDLRKALSGKFDGLSVNREYIYQYRNSLHILLSNDSSLKDQGVKQ